MTPKQRARTLERMGEKYKRLAYELAHDGGRIRAIGNEAEANAAQELARKLHRFSNRLLDAAAFEGF